MAKLIQCKTCGKEIAATCKTCVHCGAKNKGSSGCGLLLVIVLIIAAISASMPKGSQNQQQNPSPAGETEQAQLEKAFAELKNNPQISKYSVNKNKITVIYKDDLPEMVIFNMRDYAETGSRITKSAFTAECSVSAEPGKMLYSERRENRRILSITFVENAHAKNKKAEKARLAEAKRQKMSALQKELDNRAYTAFYNSFVSSWDGSCRPVVKAVKETMHDPNSFEHVKSEVFSVTGEKGMFIVEMTFRGKNAFNATVTNKVSAKLTKDGNILKISTLN